jgi:hypothetical protein
VWTLPNGLVFLFHDVSRTGSVLFSCARGGGGSGEKDPN